MHDDLLERRLRTALHEEAGRLSFAITTAELERRAALRGRAGLGNRRLTLLLAAAVAVGGLGIGGLIGGLFTPPVDSTPEPTRSVAEPTVAPSSPVVPATLPSLDELTALLGENELIVAQERGPAAAPPAWEADLQEPPASVTLDLGAESGDVRLVFTCLGRGVGELRVETPFPAPIPPIRCDGSVREVTASAPRSLTLELTEPASWRLLAARVIPRPGGRPPIEPSPLEPPEGEEALVDVDRLRIEDGFGPVDSAGRIRAEVGHAAARWWYRFALRCDGGSTVRYIHGDDFDGEFHPRVITELPCDGAVHEGELGFPSTGGDTVYVAAAPDTVVSLVVSAEPPPIELVRELPGWQLSAGIGPTLHFATQETSFTGPAGEGLGSLAVAVACTGTEDIEVTLESPIERPGGVLETNRLEFTAACTPDGAVTSASLDVAGPYADVSYTEVAGAWLAVSILVPDPVLEMP